jgi:hypothetical protein
MATSDGKTMPQTHTFQFGINGSINGVPVYAAPASETRLNIISAEFAKTCDLEIEPLKYACTLANYSKVESIGKAVGIWQFQGESLKGKVEFLVWPQSSYPVILGMDFLSHTRTLDVNWHRVRVREHQADGGFYCINLAGIAPRVIAGRIAGEPVLAIPATGCEMNLISERYIYRRGLDNKVYRDDTQQVMLADGRLAPTSGRIRARWRFGDEGILNSWGLEFFVMRDCLYDVVLGQKLLYASSAFLQYEGCFKGHGSERSHAVNKLLAGIGCVPTFMLAFQRKHGKS